MVRDEERLTGLTRRVLTFASAVQRSIEVPEQVLDLSEKGQNVRTRALVAKILDALYQLDERVASAVRFVGPQPVLDEGDERLIEETTARGAVLEGEGRGCRCSGVRVTEPCFGQ